MSLWESHYTNADRWHNVAGTYRRIASMPGCADPAAYADLAESATHVATLCQLQGIRAFRADLEAELSALRPLVESTQETAVSGLVLEAVDDDGWRYRAQIVKAGTSLNFNRYPLDVLHAAAGKYEGAPVYFSETDHDSTKRGAGSVAGWFSSVKANPTGLEGTFEINRGRPDVRDMVRQAVEIGRRTGRVTLGFSHVVPEFDAAEEKVDGRIVRTIQRIKRVLSVDLVVNPAAGGQFLDAA